jgi:SnoaL-like domain
MSHRNSLTSLNAREAITDALYRATLGFDHNDAALFTTAFIPSHESVTFDLNDTHFQGLDSIKSQLLDFVGPMDTTHMISNIRVDVKEGESTAQLNCYALAQHCLKGQGMDAGGKKYLAASEYWIDFVKGDAGWGIEKWVMKVIWTQGDSSVMQRPG